MRDSGAAEMHLEVPARSVYVGVVRLALAALARQTGLEEEQIEDLRIAVSEACANAVLSEDDGSDASIGVTWRAENGRVIVEVVDAQAPEPPATADEPEGTDRLDMSVALMRSLVDECTFERHPGGGVTTRLALAVPSN